MGNTVLVAYASKAGSTREVAEFIGKVLNESGIAADVRPAKEVKNLDVYRAVILGSAVRMGKTLPAAMNFVRKFRSTLSQKPTAYFVVCMTLKDDTPENRATVDAYLNPLREVHKPVSAGLFAGRFELARLEQPFRWMLSRDKSGAMTEGDWRDWDVIRAWVHDITPRLTIA